jgi:hypothetical protein
MKNVIFRFLVLSADCGNSDIAGTAPVPLAEQGGGGERGFQSGAAFIQLLHFNIV